MPVHLSVCLFVCLSAGISVFACVVTVSEMREMAAQEGGGRRQGCKGNRLAVKYCGVCQLHHDVLGITRSLITLN